MNKNGFVTRYPATFRKVVSGYEERWEEEDKRAEVLEELSEKYRTNKYYCLSSTEALDLYLRRTVYFSFLIF